MCGDAPKPLPGSLWQAMQWWSDPVGALTLGDLKYADITRWRDRALFMVLSFATALLITGITTPHDGIDTWECPVITACSAACKTANNDALCDGSSAAPIDSKFQSAWYVYLMPSAAPQLPDFAMCRAYANASAAVSTDNPYTQPCWYACLPAGHAPVFENDKRPSCTALSPSSPLATALVCQDPLHTDCDSSFGALFYAALISAGVNFLMVKTVRMVLVCCTGRGKAREGSVCGGCLTGLLAFWTVACAIGAPMTLSQPHVNMGRCLQSWGISAAAGVAAEPFLSAALLWLARRKFKSGDGSYFVPNAPTDTTAFLPSPSPVSYHQQRSSSRSQSQSHGYPASPQPVLAHVYLDPIRAQPSYGTPSPHARTPSHSVSYILPNGQPLVLAPGQSVTHVLVAPQPMAPVH